MFNEWRFEFDVAGAENEDGNGELIMVNDSEGKNYKVIRTTKQY
jgi:hypothetical protein